MRRRVPALAMTMAFFALTGPVTAQDGIVSSLQKGIDFTSTAVSTTTTFASGLVTRTESRNNFPRLTLNFDTLVYPRLRLNAGGVFELNLLSTSTDRLETESTLTRNRPFFLLRSTNPVFSPGVGFFRREERARTPGLSSVKLVDTEYSAYLGWNPLGGPRTDIQFLRTDTHDGNRSVENRTKGFATVISNYSHRNLGAYYRGALLDTDDRLAATKTRQTTNAARISDAESFLRRRVLWNGSYNINRQDLRLMTTGTSGQVDVAVPAFAGLSATNDFPDTARLTQRPGLADANLTASAGINIGVAIAGVDPQARNIGLDFLNPAAVNRLLLWVDRDLPVEVANAFSWQIYSSPDNVVWTRQGDVPVAPFGPFENRFEILFPAVTARYLKVVTRPLSIAVPDASRYTDILVTELQAFFRQPADQATQLARTTHIVNTDLRLRLLEGVYYEGFFLYNGPNTAGASTRTLSNGVSVSQGFARVFSMYARAAREQGWEARGARTATITNGTLTIDPIPTLRSSLLYTGQDDVVGGEQETRRGLFLQNSAQLYRGVNVLFGIGWSDTTRSLGETTHDRLTNASATIVPRQHLSVTVNFDDTLSDRSGVFVGLPQTSTRRVYAAVAFDPLRTVHLVLGEELLAVTAQPTRTTHNIGANWAPFPDGALQVIFAYNEALRPLEFGTERSTLGVVRWNLSRKSYVDVSFQRIGNHSVPQKSESRIFSVSVRLWA